VAVEQARAAWAELGLPVPAGHFHQIPERTLAVEDAEFQAVDEILVGSPEAAATFSDAPFAVRVSVNRYGYDPGLFRAKDTTRIHGGDHPQKLVFVGRCEPTKGIHVLLRAWARCERPKGSRLVLRGEMRAEIRQALAAELAEPDVVEVGPVPDMAAFLADADAMVLPSFSEGSALITYESLGCGVVPLVSRATGAPVSPGVDGLVHDTGDVGQLVEHLDATLNDPELRQRLRRAGSVTAMQLTWASVGQRLMSLYSSLVDRTSERGATP
jgi:glycosyltransferase involved in cell wall biosynthesis